MSARDTWESISARTPPRNVTSRPPAKMRCAAMPSLAQRARASARISSWALRRVSESPTNHAARASARRCPWLTQVQPLAIHRLCPRRKNQPSRATSRGALRSRYPTTARACTTRGDVPTPRTSSSTRASNPASSPTTAGLSCSVSSSPSSTTGAGFPGAPAGVGNRIKLSPGSDWVSLIADPPGCWWCAGLQ